MSVETYGEHAENAAQALNGLLQDDAIPTASDAVEQLLHCRETVVDALRQRLYEVGLNGPDPAGNLPAPPPGLNLAGVDNKLATLLNNIALSLPGLPLDRRASPVEVLTTASINPVVETWRIAAIELLAATHTLSTASDKPWLHDPGAGWYLIRDLSVALEAVLVLDARLAEVGVLNEHHRPSFALGLEEKRLIASQAARVATWHATSEAVDLATPRIPAARALVLHPISLVSAPEDLAPAQEQLARFLRPLTTNDTAYAGEPEISADSARQITASQLYLCRVFATMAASTARTPALSAFFDQRAEVLEDLQPQIRYLVDLIPPEPNMRRFWQQGELTTALTRMEDHRIPLQLQPHQMLALANATHQVTRNLGRSLRRELLRSNSNLRDAHPRLENGPVRVARRSRLGTTLTDLVHMLAPESPVEKFSSPLQRAALRRTLDLTPTAPRRPSPYPAAYSPPAQTYSR